MNNEPGKYLKALTNVLFALAVIVFGLWVLPKAVSLFMPFIIGWLISLLAGPPVLFFEKKIKMKRKAGSALVVIAVIGGICFALYGLALFLAEQIYGLAASLPEIWVSLEQDFDLIGKNWFRFLDRLPEPVVHQAEELAARFRDSLGRLISDSSIPTVGAVSSLAKNLPGAFIAVIITLLSSYFFVAEKEYVSNFLRRYAPADWRQRGSLMKKALLGALGGYFKAQLKIEVWIYLITAAGMLFLRIDYGLLIALGISLLDILPIFGTGAALLPWAVIKFLSGHYSFGIALLVIWGVGQLTRQIIQPKIVGDSIGMPPIPTLILLYLGYRLAGVMGMILAVPLGILVQTMDEAGLFFNSKASLRLLWKGFNDFRRLPEEEEPKA